MDTAQRESERQGSKRTYIYNVTQTLKPFYYKYSIIKQHFSLYEKVQYGLKRCLATSYIMCTELTQDGNVHYHMQVRSLLPHNEFKQQYKVLMNPLGRNDIAVCVSTKSLTAWNNYLHKSLDVTLERMRECAMMYPTDLPKDFRKEISKPKVKTAKVRVKNVTDYESLQLKYANEKIEKSDKTFESEYNRLYYDIEMRHIYFDVNVSDDISKEFLKQWNRDNVVFENSLKNKYMSETLDYGLEKFKHFPRNQCYDDMEDCIIINDSDEKISN